MRRIIIFTIDTSYYFCKGQILHVIFDIFAGDKCPAGYYCPLGSGAPFACPSGTFSSTEQSIDLSDCDSCKAGQYCEETALLQPTGNYLIEYYLFRCANVSVLYVCKNNQWGFEPPINHKSIKKFADLTWQTNRPRLHRQFYVVSNTCLFITLILLAQPTCL